MTDTFIIDPNNITVVSRIEMTKMNWLTFMPCGIRINTETGEVVIPESLSLNEASLAFWNNIHRVAGGFY
jgi:hypothetical protein